MTSLERMYALYKAVDYVITNDIAGDFVECGVWRGGSAMLMASALKEAGHTDRHLWLYDTFAGMTEPTERDVSPAGDHARSRFDRQQRHGYNAWCYAPLDEVSANLLNTGYPPELLHFVRGRVEDTLPALGPEKIALLRLDTDWYESTRHELEHLYPRLARRGVLILDDYGHWHGARDATDEYMRSLAERPFLCRVDCTGRIAVKP
jgi:O-methyltransferase